MYWFVQGVHHILILRQARFRIFEIFEIPKLFKPGVLQPQAGANCFCEDVCISVCVRVRACVCPPQSYL